MPKAKMPTELYDGRHVPGNEERYWLQELDSFGITAKKMNEFNDKGELGGFADNIKQTLYQDYETVYGSES